MLLDDALRAAPSSSSASTAPSSTSARAAGRPGSRSPRRFPERSFTLLEAERRKCDFLERVDDELAELAVVWGRAEEQPTDTYGVALAKALAQPPVAAELCLPLVAPGGAVVLWLGAVGRSRRASRRSPSSSAVELEDDRRRASSCSASSARRRRDSRAAPGSRRSARSPSPSGGSAL